LTEYVVTRWYRAPEVMLACQEYSKSIDIWAVGCIWGEILATKPLFQGDDYLHQLRVITSILGSPSEADLDFVKGSRARAFMAKLSVVPRREWGEVFPSADPVGLDLLGKMLIFNPSKRITAEEALEHPYFASLHSPEDEPVCAKPFLYDGWAAAGHEKEAATCTPSISASSCASAGGVRASSGVGSNSGSSSSSSSPPIGKQEAQMMMLQQIAFFNPTEIGRLMTENVGKSMAGSSLPASTTSSGALSSSASSSSPPLSRAVTNT
jgi:serine/threonine protein kinase